MFSDKFAAELGTVLQAQHQLIQKLDGKVSDLELKFSESSDGEQLLELERMMAELENSIEFLDAEDVADFDADEILRLYDRNQAAISQELTAIGYKDWNSFVRQCQVYTLQQGIDPLAPYEALLSQADLQKLQDESYEAQYRWDKWDYMFVGASGVLAALTDYFLVKIPATLKTGEYAGQLGSPLTAWLKQYNPKNADDWFAQWVKQLEKTCKVPYDASQTVRDGVASQIPGMYPKSHRFQSLGHDPVLGFVFGILDILRGTISGFSYDRLSGNHTWVCETAQFDYQPIPLIEAILKHMGHLVSDVATPMGLPAPLMSLFQGINAGSFGRKNRTVSEVARWMYLNGYDFRHFLVSGITPATVEIFLRAYIMLRHYSEFGELQFPRSSHPKYRMMLLTAHSIAAMANAGKVTLMQGNPLAINYAQWLALIRYLVPSVKYWIFDRQRLKLEHLERINESNWDDLLENSRKIIATVGTLDDRNLVLGNSR